MSKDSDSKAIRACEIRLKALEKIVVAMLRREGIGDEAMEPWLKVVREGEDHGGQILNLVGSLVGLIRGLPPRRAG